MTVSIFIIVALLVTLTVVAIIFYPWLRNENEQKVNVAIVFAFALVITSFSAGLYLWLGQPKILTNPWLAKHSNEAQLDNILTTIEQRLATNPEDITAWLVLGRTYMTIENYHKAIEAFEAAYRLDETNIDVLVRLADAYTMNNQGQINDYTIDLLLQAYDQSPKTMQVLWLLAVGYEQRNLVKKATDYWQQLVSLIQDDRELVQQIQARIHRLDNPAQTGEVSYHLTISIEPSLLQLTEPQQTLFIFASEPGGPPMPVAAIRKKVSDLPLKIQLDDSASLLPDRPLSSLHQLTIVARISKENQPTAQSGDIFGHIEVSPSQSQQKHQIILDRQVP